jgi:hypothetical protein
VRENGELSVKVSELIGAELDYWVGAAEGMVVEIKDGVCFREVRDGKRVYSPSKDWSEGGEIIEKENICWYEQGDELVVEAGELNRARMKLPILTPKLMAAMRCLVTSKYGEEVEATDNS